MDAWKHERTQRVKYEARSSTKAFDIKIKEFKSVGTITINDIKVKYFELHEPPKSTDEMMALSHYFMFELFKETILDIYNGNVSATPQAKFTSEL